MLKLEQIKIVEDNTFIAEILEPVVYDKVGEILKSDDIIAREKQNVHFILAKIVRVGPISPIKTTWENSEKPVMEIIYNVEDIVMIRRNGIEPITFPVEGYASPKLAFINRYGIVSIIEDEVPQSNG